MIAHNTIINQDRRRPTFVRCRLAAGQNPKTQKVVTMEIINDNGLIARTYGGDSGYHLLIRVNHTGDPYKDFQLLGGNSGPGGNQLQVVLYSNPTLSDQINATILNDALTPSY